MRLGAFIFGIFGALLACGLLWLAGWAYGEDVPMWGYLLAAFFGHADFYDALRYEWRND